MTSAIARKFLRIDSTRSTVDMPAASVSGCMCWGAFAYSAGIRLSPGAGVREIRVRESSGAFRCIYLATRPEGIYVLHCFQKKTQKTRQQGLDLAHKRFKSIQVKS